MLCATFLTAHLADKVLEGNFAWIKIPWKLFLPNFIECRIKFATQFVKVEYILASFMKSCAKIISKMFAERCNLLYPVWPRVYSSSVPRQIGGFLTARTKYMTGAPANVEVKPS